MMNPHTSHSKERSPAWRAADRRDRAVVGAALGGCMQQRDQRHRRPRIPIVPHSVIRSRSRKASALSNCWSAWTAAVSTPRSAPMCGLRPCLATRVDRRHHHRSADRHAECSMRPTTLPEMPLHPGGRPACRSRGRAGAPVSAARSAPAGGLAHQLFQVVAEAGPAVCGPDDLGPTRRFQLHREPASITTSAAPAAQPRRHDRQSRAISCSRAAKRRLDSARTVVFDKYRAGQSRRFDGSARRRQRQNQRNRQMTKIIPPTMPDAAPRCRLARRTHCAGAPGLDPGLLRVRSKPQPPFRRPAKIAAWPRPI